MLSEVELISLMGIEEKNLRTYAFLKDENKNIEFACTYILTNIDICVIAQMSLTGKFMCAWFRCYSISESDITTNYLEKHLM